MESDEMLKTTFLRLDKLITRRNNKKVLNIIRRSTYPTYEKGKNEDNDVQWPWGPRMEK